MGSSWPVRVGTLVGFTAVLYVVLRVFYYEPHLVPLALLVTVCTAVGWLVVDVLGDLGPSWEVHASADSVGTGHDARLSTYLRVLEGHLTSTTPDESLRDRLRQLADQRLAQRFGLDRIDPEGRARLGPELLVILEGPPRRLTVAELDRHVHRIEEL